MTTKNRIIAMVALLIVIGWGKASSEEFITLEVMSRTDNARVDNIDVSNVNRYAGLYLLPYYILINFSENNYTNWGIQLYTNNAPVKSWTPSDGFYGGLRGESNPAVRVPMYWQVYDSPQSVTLTPGGLGFYSDTLDYWGLVRDPSDQNPANSWTNLPALQERTLTDYHSLGRYPAAGRPLNHSLACLYLGIDLRGIPEPQAFNTVLSFDLYNLGQKLTDAGFTTPNPFTPSSGEKTHFNFFLKEANSTFVIRIFNLRGRLVRTLTTTRDWDGRNEGGELLEGGLYIYQVEAEGDRVSGTVVLIK